MFKKVTVQTRRELVEALRVRYGASSREEKARILPASRLFVNFFQPSFKLREKTRVGTRVIKRYHAPETPCARLLMSSDISDQVKSRLTQLAEVLDPLQLLDEIRTMQSHLAVLSSGGKTPIAAARKDNLTQFLSGLSKAWRDGEVRGTHRRIQRPQRRWRTRVDPFIASWPIVREWLQSDPAQNGKDLFRRLQQQHPGAYPDRQLRTLQRRLKEWRSQMAHELNFGADHATGDGAVESS